MRLRIFCWPALLLVLELFPLSHPAYPIDNKSVLRICDLGNDAHVRMDPHREFDERNDNILNQLFEHLLEFDIDGNPSPNLARSWRRLDELTVQFKLHPNIFFHNGEALDAYSVKFSLERNLSPELNSPSAHMLDSIDRVEIIDEYTFNIVTKYPDGILFNRLSQFGYIVPPKYCRTVGPEAFENHPVGTGPFKFAGWVKGRRLTLVRNENYWRDGLPKIGKIVFIFADTQERVDMLMGGEVDLITSFKPLDLEKIRKNGFKTIKEPSFTIMAINFNLLKQGPFQDRRVRQALNYAVNVDELIENVRQGNGIRRATLGMPGEFGYNPYIKPYSYDFEKAKELLSQAGYPEGFTASMMIDDIDGGKESVLGEVLKRQLKKLNIDLKIEGGNGALRVVNPKYDSSLPKFDLDIFARSCPDPLSHIIFNEGMVWYASNSPWSLMNHTGFDDVYHRIIRTVNLKQQTKLCHQLENMIREEAFSIFTYQEIKLYAMRKNVEYNPYITGMIYLKEATM
ncbi:MAG: ABC transporter substrate-binding protein [Deltaproteobacteria bacterium]|nr:ABC transporter substrate-binding protein [Deltaproteobacteria bacterium]